MFAHSLPSKPPSLPRVAESEIEIANFSCFCAVLEYTDRVVLVATQKRTFGSLIAAESTILPGGSRAFDVRSLLGRPRGDTSSDEAGATSDLRVLIARRVIERQALAEDLHENDEAKRVFQGRPILLSIALNVEAENDLSAVKRVVDELCNLCSNIGVPIINDKELNGGNNGVDILSKNDDDAELIKVGNESLREEVIQSFTRHQDFPKKGILFVNVLPMFTSPRCVQIVIDAMAQSLSTSNASLVCGIEARGFLFGTLLAQALRLPFVCIRKAGKLPGECQSVSYDLEYGQATIQVQRDALVPTFTGKSAIVCDDLLATGGTAKASVALLESLRVKTSCVVVLVELLGLNGAKSLSPTRVLTFAKEL